MFPLDKNQTFTIPYADLFKAYCFDREFKKLIDSGQFIFANRHLVLNNEKYIARDQSGNATLSEYALSRTWMSAVSSSRRDIAINRNIKERSITRSSCGTPLRLKIRSSIPSSLMHTTRHFLIRSRTQSAVLKHYADIPALLQRHWSRCKKRKSSQISNWQTARLLAKRPYSG